MSINSQTKNLAELCRRAWGAYEYLRDHDLNEQSGTSKRLRAANLDKLRARLVEELTELQGVVLGTHVHDGFPQDIILEGYEVFYWAVCLAVAQGAGYAEIDPASNLEMGFAQPLLAAQPLADMFQALIFTTTGADDKQNIRHALELVGRASAFAQLDPVLLLERDLAEMSQKDYLTAYWRSL